MQGEAIWLGVWQCTMTCEVAVRYSVYNLGCFSYGIIGGPYEYQAQKLRQEGEVVCVMSTNGVWEDLIEIYAIQVIMNISAKANKCFARQCSYGRCCLMIVFSKDT